MQAALRLASKGFYHTPINAAVGIADTLWDMLHANSTLVDRAADWLMLDRLCEADGSAKSAQRRAEYSQVCSAPADRVNNKLAEWQKRGFSFWKFLTDQRSDPMSKGRLWLRPRKCQGTVAKVTKQLPGDRYHHAHTHTHTHTL